MKNKRLRYGTGCILLVAFCILLSFPSCKEDKDVVEEEEEEEVVATVRVTGVTLDINDLSLASDSTVQLAATIMPENADSQGITWLSTSETVASVSQTGLVTAVAEGATSIVVKTVEGEFTDTCTVTVFVENKYKLIADLDPSATPELLDPTPADGEYWEHKSSFKLWEHKEGYGHGVKIVIVGESFSREDNKNNGVYETWCKKMALELLKNDIIRNFRNYIDIYVAVAESPVSVINGTTPGFFGTTTTIGTNFDKANAFTAEAIPELAGVLNRSYILIANGMMGGWANFGWPAGNGGSAWWSTAMANGRDNDIGAYWMMHEFIGHGFASLADEYPGATGSYDFTWQRSGMACNVSNTNDPDKLPWKRFVGLAGYREVGVFPVESGVWKSESHSIMVDDSQGFYYNAQSRWLIYKHIYDCSKFLDNQSGNSTNKPKKYESGEEAALFEAFLEFDKLYNVK
ncbi:MAG: Ig-like domain-containing protein [Tannerella sp.]|nr:Ig-like domain-containing protein [Tannerella sp.]